VGLGLVTGEVGARVIHWGAGPRAFEYTKDSQPSGDPDEANRSGWNCDVHVEYEGRPAVDWYIPTGTPIFATMEGTATLFAVTVVNAFAWYGVDRGRTWVIGPQPGEQRPFRASGGLVYVEIDSGEFLTVSAHLELAQTAGALPSNVFYAGYSPQSDYSSMFRTIPSSRAGTPIAQWQVRRGDIIGFSGDAGYSEAPHLHYTIQRAGSDTLLCPTSESGFQDGGWLLK
jgi:murein DD-endopeptidase MepM/ murein hydrolase activator NlpD